MTTLYFTKFHTKGLLKGLSTNHTLTFVSIEAATEWIRGVRKNVERGRLPYRLADCAFQKYWRD